MKILGSIWSPLLVGAMLGTTMVLFTRLPISRTNDNTLDVSTFGKNESLEIRLKIKEEGELLLKATGATTMDLVQSLNRMLKNTGKNPLRELY